MIKKIRELWSDYQATKDMGDHVQEMVDMQMQALKEKSERDAKALLEYMLKHQFIK